MIQFIIVSVKSGQQLSISDKIDLFLLLSRLSLCHVCLLLHLSIALFRFRVRRVDWFIFLDEKVVFITRLLNLVSLRFEGPLDLSFFIMFRHSNFREKL